MSKKMKQKIVVTQQKQDAEKQFARHEAEMHTESIVADAEVRNGVGR